MKCTKKNAPSQHPRPSSLTPVLKKIGHLERIDGATPLPLCLGLSFCPLTYKPPFGEWVAPSTNSLRRRQPLAIFDLKMSSSPISVCSSSQGLFGAEVPWCPWSSSVPSLNHDAAVQDPGWCQGCIWPKWSKQKYIKHVKKHITSSSCKKTCLYVEKKTSALLNACIYNTIIH